MRWVVLVARTGKMRNVYNIFVGKPARKRPLGRTKSKWEVNIKICSEIVKWIRMTQVRGQWWVSVNTIMNLTVPKEARNFLTIRVTICTPAFYSIELVS
jgi:hypothetical protein